MTIKNAEIRKRANIYHEGKVTSRTIITAEGEMKTLGVMLPGVYRFNTQQAEVMEILQGACRVKIGTADTWQEILSGQSFAVPANSHFEIEVTQLLDYICHFEA